MSKRKRPKMIRTPRPKYKQQPLPFDGEDSFFITNMNLNDYE